MKFSKVLLRRYKFRNVHKPAPDLDSGLGQYTKDYANLPERYLVRKSAKVAHISEDHPSYVPRLNKWPATFHGVDRPWTDFYWQKYGAFNPEKHPDIVQPIKNEDWMWFRGDRVEIMKGKDKGKQGIIVNVIQEKNWVIVENINLKHSIMENTHEYPGFCYYNEQPLLVTEDIKLVDPEDDQACDVEWRFLDDGQRVRISTRYIFGSLLSPFFKIEKYFRSKLVIPKPAQAESTKDYKRADAYVENKEKDTTAKVVEKETFVPKLATFEMDLMDEYGIKEDRVPAKTFWY